ncbi:MAG: metal ABC transporter permease [Planctomycetota bacterium]
MRGDWRGIQRGLAGLLLCSVLLSGCGTAPGAAPTESALSRVLLLQDYNTRVVILGATLLGTGAGFVGCFTLLRRRALIGDALSHATLPGVGLAFLLAPILGIDGKSLPALLAGAAISGGLGVTVRIAVTPSPPLIAAPARSTGSDLPSMPRIGASRKASPTPGRVA